jgi:hypothetical protein
MVLVTLSVTVSFLIAVAFFRELLGSGTLLGFPVIPHRAGTSTLIQAGFYANNGFFLFPPMALDRGRSYHLGDNVRKTRNSSKKTKPTMFQELINLIRSLNLYREHDLRILFGYVFVPSSI